MYTGVHYQKLNKNNFKLLKKSIKNLDSKTIKTRYGQMLNYNKIIESIEASQITICIFKHKNIAGFGQVFKLPKQKYPEIGYIIFKKYRKKGYGYLLTKKILSYCKAHKISLKGEAELKNTPSVGLLKKVGTYYPPLKAYNSNKYQPNTYVCYWNFR